MSVKYSFSENEEFVIDDYDQAPTFASFLPGIAGVDGIPMWSFYVNRGQVMGSFGVKDKDGTIMEFSPASVMYRNIERQGFRTFIRCNGSVHELFSSISNDKTDRKLLIENNAITISEVNHTLKICVTVTYFTMPHENFAAIVRKVQLENLGEMNREIEILDGLPLILPFGVSNADYQAEANLIRAWFDVENIENNIPYYKIRASVADTAEVHDVNEGNFFLSFSSESKGLIAPVYDMSLIFGENTALSKPSGWNCDLELLTKREQISQNKASGGFSHARTTLNDNFVLCTIIGHAATPDLINDRKLDFSIEYINKKEKEARMLTHSLLMDVKTKTSNLLFDRYISQCYMDNFLRGGYPLLIGADDQKTVYHIYSRKHGDLEREYNFFSLEPSFYSQGNGNFRDMNQNRRNDVLIQPGIEAFNVKLFMSLIQADGFNPLVVKGCSFTMDEALILKATSILDSHQKEIAEILRGSFTPGQLVTYLSNHPVSIKQSNVDFLTTVLDNADQNFEADFGEGYWIDHWTYNMDLIDSYLMIYPDKKEEFLFLDATYRTYQSPVYVLPREDRFVLVDGKVRQYGSVLEETGVSSSKWLKTQKGSGCIYTTSLFSKLLMLATIKFASLDPEGMGIEMDGGRPGWNDAMNGLPGLFGSAMGETAELKRLVEFLLNTCLEYQVDTQVFKELSDLISLIEVLLNQNLNDESGDFEYWDKVSRLKEHYRQDIRKGIIGQDVRISTRSLIPLLRKMNLKLQKGIDKAMDIGQGLFPTYFYYPALDYEVIPDKVNPVNGYTNVSITKFDCKMLPAFLEGPARLMKTMKNGKQIKYLYDAVKDSELFDQKIKMYKTSVSLNTLDSEAGRIKAFTPGWLERESVFLHMEYKYLYAMLKAGLYERFFADIQSMFIPFLEPETYGRSTIENSSFIASSVNPDEAVHGRGFVARLSGSTAEFLSMWFEMMAGHAPFCYENGELRLGLQPILPSWLFEKNSQLSFTFLGKTKVTYINQKNCDTYGPEGVKPIEYRVFPYHGEMVSILGSKIGEPFAKTVRDGDIEKIEVFLS